MNVLIIGFGNVGKYYYELLKKEKKIKNIFVFETGHKSNKKINYIDFDINQIKYKNIKHAFICTPSNLHYIYAKKLIENNINVVVEKPFVLKLSHANDLIKISKNKKNLKVWVAFQNRTNLAIQKAKKIIKQKIFGNIFLVDSSLIWSRDKNYYKTSWRGNYKSDGGVLTNQAIHLLDSLIYLFGDVLQFNGILEFNKKKLQAEDLIILNLKHKNKIISGLKATTRADSNYMSAMDIIGEKGRIIIKGISLNTIQTLKNNKIKFDKLNSENFGFGAGPFAAMGNGHQKLLGEFLNNNCFKSSYDLEIEKNLHVMKVIHSVYKNLNNRKFLFKVKNIQSNLGK